MQTLCSNDQTSGTRGTCQFYVRVKGGTAVPLRALRFKAQFGIATVKDRRVSYYQAPTTFVRFRIAKEQMSHGHLRHRRGSLCVGTF